MFFNKFTLNTHIKGPRIDTSATINSNKWTHIVWVHSGTNGKTIIYVDGIPEKAVVMNKLGAVKISPNGLWLGNDQDTVGGTWEANQQFFGIMDDISFYNRILSESEIQQLYKPIEDEKPPIEISSKATYYSKNKTLYLESILVPFIDEFSGEETDIKGIFDAQLKEKSRFEFELIPSSITFNEMFEGEETSSYILYDHKKRSVKIPCFKVMTIAKFGNGIEGKAIYYKNVLLKQRHVADLIFNAEDMTKTDSCN